MSLGSLFRLLPYLITIFLIILAFLGLKPLYEKDRFYTLDLCFQDNLSRIRQIESLTRLKLDSLQQELIRDSVITDPEAMRKLENQHIQLNESRLSRILGLKNLERTGFRGMDLPLGIVPYRRTKNTNASMYHRLQSVFGVKEVPYDQRLYGHPELGPFKKLGIVPFYDPVEMTPYLNARDFALLNSQPGFTPWQSPHDRQIELKGPGYFNPVWIEPSVTSNSPVMDIFSGSEDDTTRLYPVPDGQFAKSEEIKDLQTSEMPLVWIANYVWRKSGRFGPAHNPLYPLLESNRDVKAMLTPKTFFKGLGYSLAWNFYPDHYASNPDPQKIYVLAPRIIMIWLDELTMATQLLPSLLHLHPLEKEVSLLYREIWSGPTRWAGNLNLLKNLAQENLFYFDPLQGLKDFEKSPVWAKERIKDPLQAISAPLHFLQKTASGTVLYTLILSPIIGNKPVLIACDNTSDLSFREIFRLRGHSNTPTLERLEQFKKRWLGICGLFLCACLFFLYKSHSLATIFEKGIRTLLQTFYQAAGPFLPLHTKIAEFHLFLKTIQDFRDLRSRRQKDFFTALGLQELVLQPLNNIDNFCTEAQYLMRDIHGPVNIKKAELTGEVEEPAKVAWQRFYHLAEESIVIHKRNQIIQKQNRELALARSLDSALLPSDLPENWNLKYSPCEHTIVFLDSLQTTAEPVFFIAKIWEQGLNNTLVAMNLKYSLIGFLAGMPLLQALQEFEKEIFNRNQIVSLCLGQIKTTGLDLALCGLAGIWLEDKGPILHVKPNLPPLGLKPLSEKIELLSFPFSALHILESGQELTADFIKQDQQSLIHWTIRA